MGRRLKWNCDGFGEIDPNGDDTIKDSIEEYEETKCQELGCYKGWVILLYSQVPCAVCNSSGKIRKKKNK